MIGPHNPKGSARGCNLLPSHDHGSLVSHLDQSNRYRGTRELASACVNAYRSGGLLPVYINEDCRSRPEGGAA